MNIIAQEGISYFILYNKSLSYAEALKANPDYDKCRSFYITNYRYLNAFRKIKSEYILAALLLNLANEI